MNAINTLLFYIKNKYGSFYKYPTQDHIKQALHLFNGHLTLSENDLRAFEALSYEIEEIPDPDNQSTTPTPPTLPTTDDQPTP